MKKEAFLDHVKRSAKKELSEAEIALFSTLGETVEAAFTQDQIERKKALDPIMEQLQGLEAGQSIGSVIRSLNEQIVSLENKTKRSFSSSEQFQLKEALEAKKDEILSVIRKQSNTPWGLEFKAKRAASAMMTTSTVVTGAVGINTDNLFDDLEITVIKYPANFIGDAISSRLVSKVPAAIQWKEQKAVSDGVPAVVAEGAVKPLIDKAFEFKYAYRVKYAGRIEMTEEVEIDFEQLMLDIIDMFESDVLRKYNAGLLADLLAWAPSYTATTLDGTIVKPTIMNVVNAGKLQISNANHMADVLVINPGDYAETQNMQNTTGDPIFVPDSVLFPGLKLFVSNNITAGTALLGDSQLIKEQHGSYILRSGTYGNQLIENEKTIIGEIFSIMKLPTLSKVGWVKLDVATVKAALLLVP